MDKTLRDLLFSARWAVSADKKDFAFEKLTSALEHIGALKSEVQKVDRPSDPMPELFNMVREPKFVVVKGVKYKDLGNYKTSGGYFDGLVVHYTVSNRSKASAIGNVKYLASKGFGCMVMDEDGTIYIPEDFDVLKDWGQHAGVSRWDGSSYVSSRFAGMEICCWGRGSKVGPFRESNGQDNIISGKYQTFTDAQEDELINFCLWALTVNPMFRSANILSMENVVGHDEVRAAAGKKGDKTDPGASLSMTMPKFREFLTAQVKAFGLDQD